MKKFKFFWLDGKVDEGEGNSVSDAFTRLGYGAGALRALDYWKQVSDNNDSVTSPLPSTTREVPANDNEREFQSC